MEQQIIEVLLSALGVVITGVVGIVGNEIKKFVKTKHAETLAQMAVQFVEETFDELDGKKKFKKAAELLVRKLGGKVSDEDIEVLVQSAVNKLRGDIKDAVSTESEPDKDADNNGTVPEPTPDLTPIGNLTVDQLKQLINDAIKQNQAS